MSRWIFLSEFFRGKASTGSVAPSSKALVLQLVSEVKIEAAAVPRSPLRVLEVGPGVGPITAELVRILRSEDELVLVELNPKFCEILRRRNESWQKDGGAPKVEVRCEDILTSELKGQFDFVVTSLPFTNFDIELTRDIFRKLISLRPRKLSFFEYIGFRRFRRGISLLGWDERMKALDDFYAAEIFPRLHRTEWVIWSLPPAHVFHLETHESQKK